MSWIATAISATAIIGIVNILDSHLITKRMPSYRAFLLAMALPHIIFLAVILSIYPLPVDAGTTPLLIAFSSGIVRMSGLLIMLYVMRSEEV